MSRAPLVVLTGLLATTLSGCLEPNIEPDLDLVVQVVHTVEVDTGEEPRTDSVYVRVDGAEHDGRTDDAGEVRFYELPPGEANVTVLTRHYSQPQMQSQMVTIGGDPVTLEFRFPT